MALQKWKNQKGSGCNSAALWLTTLSGIVVVLVVQRAQTQASRVARCGGSGRLIAQGAVVSCAEGLRTRHARYRAGCGIEVPASRKGAAGHGDEGVAALGSSSQSAVNQATAGGGRNARSCSSTQVGQNGIAH